MTTFPRGFVSITAGPSPDGSQDSLNVCSVYIGGPNWLEVMSKFPSDLSQVNEANYLDASVNPVTAEMLDAGTMRIYGLHHLEGFVATVWAAGVDLGEFNVQPGGYIDLIVDAPGSLFTTPRLVLLTTNGSQNNYEGNGVHVKGLTSITEAAPISATLMTQHVDLNNVNYGSRYDIFAVDWDNGFCFEYTADGPGGFDPFFLKKVDIATGLTVEEANSNTELHGGSAPLMFGQDNFLYAFGPAINSGAVQKISVSGTISVVDTFGSANGAFTTDANHLQVPNAICWTKDSAGPNMILAASFLTPCLLSSINADTMALAEANFSALDEQTATFTQTNVPGVAYVLGVSRAPPANADPLGLYRIDTVGSSSSVVPIRKIDPTDIDPTWTEFGTAASILFDETDGNILLQVGGPSLDGFILKMDATTGNILWQIPIQGCNRTDIMSVGRIRFGQYTHLSSRGTGSSYPLYVIDTIAGTAVTSTVIGVDSIFSVNDDTTGALIGLGSYGPGAGAPVPGPHTNPSGFVGPWFTLGPTQPVVAQDYDIPIVVGLNYESKAQLLRPLAPEAAGTSNGPALAKTRRLHQFGVLLNRTQKINFSTDFDTLYPAELKDAGGTVLPLTTLFSGVHWNTINDDNSFDGMLCWSVTRPYPATVLAVEGFLKGEDR